MYQKLEEITFRPDVFGFYTAEALWSDEYRSTQMLAIHLDESIDVSSRSQKFIKQSVDWIRKEFSIYPGFKLCDFGCGPGLYTNLLAKAGAKVTGIDFSKNSIEYAKRTVSNSSLDIQYINANYLDPDLKLDGQFDLIIMIMCDFCALSPNQRKELLLKFDALLAPKGRILLDVYSINSFNSEKEQAVFSKNHLNNFWYEEDYYCFINTFKYEEEKVILDKYSLFPESGNNEVVYNWIQCFDIGSFKKELEGTNLKVTSVYSDVCGKEYDSTHTEFAVVMEKAG